MVLILEQVHDFTACSARAAVFREQCLRLVLFLVPDTEKEEGS